MHGKVCKRRYCYCPSSPLRLDFHLIRFLILSFTSEKSIKADFPSLTLNSLSFKTSACHSGLGNDSESFNKSSHIISISAIFSEVDISHKGTESQRYLLKINFFSCFYFAAFTTCLNTLIKFSPHIFLRSSLLYPRRNNSAVMFGNSETSLQSLNPPPPSKSVPIPT